MKKAEEQFKQLLAVAKKDPNILAFWLDGSRGKGLITEYSDYDCTMIVSNEVLQEHKKRYATFGRPQIECSVMTVAAFKAYAAWGSPTAWDRYNYAHLKTLVDKTGQMQQLIEEKVTVPVTKAKEFITSSLDHYINQVFRVVKCYRDNNPLAARFEAAESIAPLLDALFALEHRIRPFYKYLEWELANFPLQVLPYHPDQFIGKLKAILTGGLYRQQQLLNNTERLFRTKGYNRVFDDWGEKLEWMKQFKRP